MKESIRLFADAHILDGEFQGSRTFLREIYNILSQKENIEIYLGAYNISSLEKNFSNVKNIRFIKYKSRSSVYRLLFDIPSILKKYKIDYAHFQYIVPLKKSCKFIVTTHDVIFNEYPEEFNFVYRKIKNFLFNISAQKADILTTVSAYSKKSIQKYFGIEEEKIHITPNGVNEVFFQPYNKQDSKKYIQREYGFDKFILYVSRFEPRKNHAMLLKVFLDLKLYNKNYHLVLLGAKSIATPEFDDMLNKLSQPIKSFIFINEAINDKNIIEFYRAADVFVYPSKAEGFGIPPLEAAAVKIPVLCSNSSAMSDFVFFGDDLFDPFNYEEFKMKLENICKNGTNDANLSDICNTVRQKYSWKESAEILYKLIQEKSM